MFFFAAAAQKQLQDLTMSVGLSKAFTTSLFSGGFVRRLVKGVLEVVSVAASMVVDLGATVLGAGVQILWYGFLAGSAAAVGHGVVDAIASRSAAAA